MKRSSQFITDADFLEQLRVQVQDVEKNNTKSKFFNTIQKSGTRLYNVINMMMAGQKYAEVCTLYEEILISFYNIAFTLPETIFEQVASCFAYHLVEVMNNGESMMSVFRRYVEFINLRFEKTVIKTQKYATTFLQTQLTTLNTILGARNVCDTTSLGIAEYITICTQRQLLPSLAMHPVNHRCIAEVLKMLARLGHTYALAVWDVVRSFSRMLLVDASTVEDGVMLLRCIENPNLLK